MSRHVNIPIFIPHLGCPNMCVFCNQRTISGVEKFDILKVKTLIEDSLRTVHVDDEVEIAFFGGSFTGIDRELMISLLELAHKYVVRGKVTSIRCSTRPDYINEEILSILKKYSVNVIELGLQSADDSVLSACKRGHKFDSGKKACELIINSGFTLVGQMMIGLPKSTPKTEIDTADFIIHSGASAARIYPTVVFRDTELCDMCDSGKYAPLTLEDAVNRSAAVFSRLTKAGVKVIRIGLCASDNLVSDDTYYAGPNHPALGELVENKFYYDAIENQLIELGHTVGKKITVLVPRGAVSKAVGQNKRNKLYLSEKFSLKDINFKEDDSIRAYQVMIRCEER